jgi:hypothetical protein
MVAGCELQRLCVSFPTLGLCKRQIITSARDEAFDVLLSLISLVILIYERHGQKPTSCRTVSKVRRMEAMSLPGSMGRSSHKLLTLRRSCCNAVFVAFVVATVFSDELAAKPLGVRRPSSLTV